MKSRIVMMINFSDQKIKGKSWTESIYNFSSWREPNKDEYFLQDVPVRVRLRATKVGRRISNPVSHIIYKVLTWIKRFYSSIHLSPQVDVTHGKWNWSVEKRFQNFISLHTTLIFFKGSRKFNFNNEYKC